MAPREPNEAPLTNEENTTFDEYEKLFERHKGLIMFVFGVISGVGMLLLLLMWSRQIAITESDAPEQHKSRWQQKASLAPGDEEELLPTEEVTRKAERNSICGDYFTSKKLPLGNYVFFRTIKDPEGQGHAFEKERIEVSIDSVPAPRFSKHPIRRGVAVITLSEEDYQRSKRCLPSPRLST